MPWGGPVPLSGLHTPRSGPAFIHEWFLENNTVDGIQWTKQVSSHQFNAFIYSLHSLIREPFVKKILS